MSEAAEVKLESATAQAAMEAIEKTAASLPYVS